MNKQIKQLTTLYFNGLEYAKINYPNELCYYEDLLSDKKSKEFKNTIEKIEYDKINWDKFDNVLDTIEDLFDNANNHKNGNLYYEVLYYIFSLFTWRKD